MSAQQRPADAGVQSAPARIATVSALPSRRQADAALLRAVCDQRDRRALGALAEHYAPRLKAWLMNRGEQAHTAEDIVQDVFIMIWTKAEQFDPDRGSFSTWAYRIARNRWIDGGRKAGRTQLMPPDEMSLVADAPVAAADGELEHAQMCEAVNAALAALPPEQKQMLQLAFFDGLSHSEISARTGLPLGTVKGRIRAALQKLQERLKNFSGVDE